MNQSYRFLWHRPDGRLDRIVSLAREPLAMTEDDRLIIDRRWDQRLRENNVPLDVATQVKSSIYYADVYPAYSVFACGPAGTLLVQRVRPFRGLNESEREEIRVTLARPPGAADWDVFDREGRYLGPVAIPGTAWIHTWHMIRFSQDRDTGAWNMYSVWSDEQGVEYVVSWRIDGRMPG